MDALTFLILLVFIGGFIIWVGENYSDKPESQNSGKNENSEWKLPEKVRMFINLQRGVETELVIKNMFEEWYPGSIYWDPPGMVYMDFKGDLIFRLYDEFLGFEDTDRNLVHTIPWENIRNLKKSWRVLSFEYYNYERESFLPTEITFTKKTYASLSSEYIKLRADGLDFDNAMKAMGSDFYSEKN